MDLNSFQRKAVILIFTSVLIGAVLLAKKEPLKTYFPKKKEAKKAQKSDVPKQTKIDINTADIYLLSKLPGIGPGLSRRIIDYRNTHGPFQSLGELQNVPGIGPKRIERIKDKVNLSGNISSGKTNDSDILDLNTASPEQLATIIGIGPKIARAITEYRKNHGPFDSVDELSLVPRIGDKTCEKLKEYLYIGKKSVSPLAHSSNKKIVDTRKRSHEIDTSLSCPHCKKPLYGKGRKKKVYIRCPNCLKSINEK